jgi:hypothetical protein
MDTEIDASICASWLYANNPNRRSRCTTACRLADLASQQTSLVSQIAELEQQRKRLSETGSAPFIRRWLVRFSAIRLLWTT